MATSNSTGSPAIPCPHQVFSPATVKKIFGKAVPAELPLQSTGAVCSVDLAAYLGSLHCRVIEAFQQHSEFVFPDAVPH